MGYNTEGQSGFFKCPNNQFIVKELAVISIDDKARDIHGVRRMLSKPPFKWDDLPKQYKTMNLWIMRNYYEILWDAGDIPYNTLNDALDIILKDVVYIYVKIAKKIQMQGPSIGRSLELYYQLEERIEDMKPQDIAYLTKDFILKFAPTKIDRI
ncbi:hypothetical protein PV325_010506 [Microctonus aethiopoides]|uniref:Uncharacterized protein n=1 Tax=Microctonus aethiopoides TaxID=144406 RepID=A0AA39FWD4_9HYME|nr:hypothetical protein PV325_010506 [Microctonus aethiopoides]KAK0177092.1 hypothetical protein PV328_001171 [Microctonus aethiopoides]